MKYLFVMLIGLSCSSTFAQEGLAASKSRQQASQGIMRHVGGGFGGGRYEGVGFSSRSAQDALRRCCYYGTRPIRDQAVVHGYNRQLRCWGWFATVIYN